MADPHQEILGAFFEPQAKAWLVIASRMLQNPLLRFATVPIGTCPLPLESRPTTDCRSHLSVHRDGMLHSAIFITDGWTSVRPAVVL